MQECEIVVLSDSNVELEYNSQQQMPNDDSDIICIEDSIHHPSGINRENNPSTNNSRPNEINPLLLLEDSFDFLTNKDIVLSEIQPPKPITTKRKTKEEISHEKLIKQQERDEKKAARIQAKQEKEREKLKRRIEREAAASINTKAENYIYCHIGNEICAMLDDCVVQTRMLFLDRKIESQLVIDSDIGTRVEWKRKCVEVSEENGHIERFEYMSYQHVFGVFVPGSTFKDMVSSQTINSFIEQQINTYPLQNAECFILCFGAHNVQSKKVMEIGLNIFERYRAQIHFFNTSSEFALFLAQMIRGLSKRVHCESSQCDKDFCLDSEKGLREESRDVLVADWWNKMLSTLWRSGDAQRRAIVKSIPDPIKAGKKYGEKGYLDSMKELADIMCENGRRLGPALAHRLYMILTDFTGTQIAE